MSERFERGVESVSEVQDEAGRVPASARGSRPRGAATGGSSPHVEFVEGARRRGGAARRQLVADPEIAAASDREDTAEEQPDEAEDRAVRGARERCAAEEALPAGAATEIQLRAEDLTKSFRKAAAVIPVLKGVDLEVREGEFLAIVGQSGSGKSTLLHLLATLDAPDRGEIYYRGQRIDQLPLVERDRLRNHRLGMIFQFYHLLPELSALENVLVPVMIGRSTWQFFRYGRAYRQIAKELLEMVGLGHRLKHKPRELSGGELQRAAIARALISGPEILLADEPTGNLDQGTGREILEILYSLNRQHNLTIVMVTHDPAIAREADRVVRLVDGRVEHG